MKANNRFYVYVWIRLDKNEVFYVGKGSGNRFKDMSMRNKYFMNVVNCVGMKNIRIDILEEGLTEKVSFDREKYYIEYYKSESSSLTNMTDGGEGSSNWFEFLTEEEKDKHREVSKSFTGRKHTQETKNKISESHKGMNTSEETRKKLSDISIGRESAFKGKKHSEATKKTISDKAKGRKGYWAGKKMPEESRLKMINTLKEQAKTKDYITAKHVLVIDKNGDIKHEFKSRAKCIEYFSNCEVTISEACIKKYLKNNKPLSSQYKRHEIYLGYIFIYRDDYNSKPQSTIERVFTEKNCEE